MMKNEKVGAVLVAGGGIAGVQASLDLAESGYYVYLVEKTPSIGGVMAQLDKTFPTNDCSMCILSPKLVETGRHQNIKIITQAVIEGVAGKAGNFRVILKKAPRYIIEDKCIGCAECVEACPVERPSAYEEGLAARKAIYRPYIQAIPNIFTIDKNERAPCVTTCPINTNAQGYIALISQKKFSESLRLIREKNPLPSICGRACTHPCERECNRADVDEPIAIRALKRFVADYEMSMSGEEIEPAPRTKEEKVAIIGSGPAGLTAAYDLVKLGYGVTIFEALPLPGGMLSVGIPEYRLPKKILQYEIETIRKLGVEIKLNKSIGKDLTIDQLFQLGYQAIFLAVGAHKSLNLDIPGEDLKGVYPGVSFLREVNLGKKVKVGKKVAVVGGGNVAIDSARTALRLGAKEVFILYRRSREEMPAAKEEIEEVENEGVKIQYLVAPVKILGKDKKVKEIECIRMELGEPDESGRKRPVPIKGSEFRIEADMIIPAIGQAPELSFLPEGKFKLSRRGTLEVDQISLETNIPGIFAGGDAVKGPATIIEAMAAGRRASHSIDRYLSGEDLKTNREDEFLTTTDAPLDIDLPRVEKRARQSVSVILVEERVGNFKEVELGFSEEEAVYEAERCLDCGICSECLECLKVCKAEAIDHQQEGETIGLNVGSVILAPGFDEFDSTALNNYGYQRFPNVVTSIEFERILSATGPYQGNLLRPSDRNIPKKIAFIQCVGSRDSTNPYCSSVCCTYAVKEAIVAKEHAPVEIEETIFYMDMRTYGKDFDKYRNRAEEEYGVRFVRARVASVEGVAGSDDLRLTYETEGGTIRKELFNMVVLSVGFNPPESAKVLAEKLGIELNEYNFAKTSGLAPLATSREGIYVCGAFSGPKDIPETVMQASGVVGSVGAILSEARGTLVKTKEYLPEKDVAGKEPRIGIFVCHCGINIGGVVDVPSVTEYAKTLSYVVYAENNLFTCSDDTQKKIRETIEEHDLNRVIVASCSPRTHEPLFQETLKEAGLNKYLFEMANIRDQCSWIHMHEHGKATGKAKDLVRMAVAKAALLEPLATSSLSINPSGLVIGGGIAGMTSALNLAEQGFKVFLVERELELGGNLRRIQHTLEGEDTQEYLKNIISEVQANKNIEVFLGAEIEEIAGYVGNYRTSLKSAGKAQEIEHGIVIVATGAGEYQPDEYLYGELDNVLTQLELEERLAKKTLDPKSLGTVVMIQCVG
ncbi:MAG: FAD-dependent oxidoreductase, partial [Deltaproteobacteria bacterium]